MKKSLAIALSSAALLMVFGSWTVVARAQDSRVDFTFFDGTNPNPDSEGPPDGGAECQVQGPATLHASFYNHSSGQSGKARLTYQDGDIIDFPIEPGQTLQLTQAIGNRVGADRKVRLSARDANGQPTTAATGPKLVGSMSAISQFGHTVECRSCKANDPAGDQNPPAVLNTSDCHNAP